MIWGEAGVGKTTFCSKFCLDWALVVTEMEGRGQELADNQKSELEKLTEEQRSKLNNIGLLFYIVLRDIGSKTVKDTIISKLGFNKLNDSQLSSLLENVNECSKFVIVMDGFDEISDKDEHVEDVLTGPSYHNVYSIITCRPHATRGIVLNVDVEIRLMGFSEAQAKAFVEMFARIKYNDQNQIESFVKQTMSQIESSADLLEMSTNPSMLQLLCLLSWKKGNIGKNRTSVFKYYTHYLLVQYHIKQGKNEKLYSNDLYKQNLLDAGKVALMGLKQNQLQLVFSKGLAHQIGGDTIFDIGFLSELPGSETDDGDNKVQFTHRVLQEYLAAFYVVNTPVDEGLQLLMEFCSTSQRLMGSQIILEFISNMSTKMGKIIQKLIKEFVLLIESDDKVDPKSRTSSLISMLEQDTKITFPLPTVVDIDLREYDIGPGFVSKFRNMFKTAKSALERFFDMDGHGVKRINLILGKHKRLSVLTNTSMNSLNELIIDYCQSWSKGDNEDLCEAMKKMKPGLLCITECHKKLMDEATIDVISLYVHTLILEKCDLDQEHLLLNLKTKNHVEVLKVTECDVKMDDRVIEAVSKLTSDIKLDISGKEITLIHKLDGRKSLSIANCGIHIDTKIAKAVSRLPNHTQLDLSGNQVTDKSAGIKLIHKAANIKSLSICNCGIEIDTEIAEAVSRLPDHTQLDLSGNQVTDKSACITLIHKAATMKSLNIHDCMSNCGIQIDTEIAEAVSRLPDHSQLDLSGNQVTDKSVCITLIHKAATIKSLNIHNCMANCGIQIDTEIAEAVSRLPDHTQLDLSGNQVTDKSACITLIHKVATMKSLNIHNCMSNCGIQIDTEIAEAVSRLPDHTELDMSGNQVTDKSAYIILIHKAATMKSLNISNCSIKIDEDIAEAVSRLPDDIQLDLSGNKLTKIDPRLLPEVLLHMPEDKEIDMTEFSITVDVDIVTALSEMPQLKSLKASCNKLTSEAAREFSMSQLQHLELSNCGINDTVCVTLMKSLSEHCPLLEILDLSNRETIRFPTFVNYNDLTSVEWCDHVQMKQLRKLFLCYCGISDTVCVSLMKNLSKHCPMLEVLDLDSNELTSDEWCQHVKMQRLRELNLSYFDFTGTVCVSLMKGLSKHCPLLERLILDGNCLTSVEWCHQVQMKQLMKLYLYRCGLSDTVCVSLMISLSKHCLLLEVLDLSNNDLPSDEWCHHVQMKKLRELDLIKCGINDTVCKSLMISLSKHCPSLEILDLGLNNLTSSGLSEIVEKIKHLKQLRELGLFWNPCMGDWYCRQKVKETLQNSNPELKVERGVL